jgi:hypothetical protein
LPAVATKSVIISALCGYFVDAHRREARRFLQGLSTDELQYIADFVGACLLEINSGVRNRAEVASRVLSHAQRRGASVRDSRQIEDRDHKMILLLEYLSRCGFHRFSITS